MPQAVQPSKAHILKSDTAWAAAHAKGSIAWAVTRAEETGKKTVVTDETTPTTYPVANPDGTLTTELTVGPERVWKNGASKKAKARDPPGRSAVGANARRRRSLGASTHGQPVHGVTRRTQRTVPASGCMWAYAS
ncbi:hypothetical protein ACIOJD_13635 [Streptomyces sp. NPDC088116]|uniref:hypothetical protein n=1 Tax=Streptomyces sp. NPDC088116 TaxID=3365825 RepID=UPI00382EE927